MSLAEVANMAVLQLFTLGGSGDMLPQEILVILGVLRCILRDTEKHTELLGYCELLKHWKPSPSARDYTIYLLYAYTIVLVCLHKLMYACPTHARKADWSCDSMHY